MAKSKKSGKYEKCENLVNTRLFVGLLYLVGVGCVVGGVLEGYNNNTTNIPDDLVLSGGIILGIALITSIIIYSRMMWGKYNCRRFVTRFILSPL